MGATSLFTICVYEASKHSELSYKYDPASTL